MLSNLFNDTSLGKLVYDTKVQTELENQSINLQWKHNCHVRALHPPEGKTVVGIPFSNALGVCGWSVISQKFLFQQNFKIRKHCKNSARNFFLKAVGSQKSLSLSLWLVELQYRSNSKTCQISYVKMYCLRKYQILRCREVILGRKIWKILLNSKLYPLTLSWQQK